MFYLSCFDPLWFLSGSPFVFCLLKKPSCWVSMWIVPPIVMPHCNRIIPNTHFSMDIRYQERFILEIRKQYLAVNSRDKHMLIAWFSNLLFQLSWLEGSQLANRKGVLFNWMGAGKQTRLQGVKTSRLVWGRTWADRRNNSDNWTGDDTTNRCINIRRGNKQQAWLIRAMLGRP